MHEQHISRAQQNSLRRWNLGAAALHVAQAVVVVALATDFSLPVTGTYLQGPPGTIPQDPVVLFEIRTGLAVAAFVEHRGLVLRPAHQREPRPGGGAT